MGIGAVVITIIVACAVAGAIASIRDPERGLGKEFLDGLHAIGQIFVPVAGIMASIPFLQWLINLTMRPLFSFIGADPALSAASFIASDMGSYSLARELAVSTEGWIMAMFTGTMAGATIVFSIPVGLTMLEQRDHKYMALGVLAGLLSIPVGVFVSSLLCLILSPDVRSIVSRSAVEDHPLAMQMGTILINLLPLVLLVSLLAAGLWMAPTKMIRGFMAYGRFVDIAIKLVLVAVIVELLTVPFYGRGLFTLLFGSWGFDPIIVDSDQVKGKLVALTEGKEFVSSEDVRNAIPESYLIRALEVAGYIGVVLAGAFPMVYLMRKYLSRPMERLGSKLGLSAPGAAGILAASANILAMFRLIRDMPAKDKVLNIAFAVCAAFMFGDHLAFTAGFQPHLLAPVLAGKLTGGIFAFWLAYRLSVPKALELEKLEMQAHALATCEQMECLRGKLIDLERLGGSTNLNFRVHVSGKKFVLRIAGADTEELGINRASEATISKAMAEARLGPTIIECMPNHSAMLSEFCEGESLEGERFFAEGVLERVGKTLRRCHELTPPEGVGSFSPFKTVRTYIHKAREKGVSLPENLPLALEKMSRIEAELAEHRTECLCHNDLLPGNFIDNGTELRIIDWEYGGVGDPFFDLGNLAVNAQLTEQQEEQLLKAYFDEIRPEDIRRLRLMRLVSDMREATWGFLQAGIAKGKPHSAKTPEHYHEYGRKHLDRFLDRASNTTLV